MNVIAGLGNPGAGYANTPHSIGFEVADAVAQSAGAAWKSSPAYKGDLATCRIGDKKVILVKPMTFMNLSGDSVAPVVKYHNSTPADLIVISDDIDLPVGRIRIRRGGSAGGHNGLKSVIERLGSQDFVRVRIGVGRDPADRSDVVAHVLGKFDPRTRGVMDEVVASAREAVECLVTNGLEIAMNRFNGWTAEAGKEKQ